MKLWTCVICNQIRHVILTIWFIELIFLICPLPGFIHAMSITPPVGPGYDGFDIRKKKYLKNYFFK